MSTNKTNPSLQGDIHDSKRDDKYLQTEEVTMELPEVEDIPGQEQIHPQIMKAFADVTISSDDEEGKNIEGFNDEEEDLDVDSSVTTEEKELLERSANSMSGPDDKDQLAATLDNTDEDGDPLNEEVDATGSDLDVPGSEDDDENEEIGEEDEENNSYSLGGDRD